MALVSVTFQIVGSFDEALAIAGPGGEHGALAPLDALPDINAPSPMRRGPGYIGHCLAALGIAVANTPSPSLRVLDIGGASGEHYLLARDVMPDQAFDWTVLELANYVKHGRCFFSHVPGLRFVERIEDSTDQFDLIYACGVLQFCRHLDDILPAKVLTAPLVFVARSAVAKKQVVYVQTVTYTDRVNVFCARVIGEAELADHMQQHGYELWLSWDFDVHSANERRNAPAMIWRRTA